MPQFPAAESLRRFFGADPRVPVPLAELASLLGVSREAARAILDEEGGHPSDGPIAWSEAAALLFDAWPRMAIIDALGPELGRLIPAQFRLVPVRWGVPIFILRAMEYQAIRAWYGDPRGRLGLVPDALHARELDDYIADLLHAAIEPATLAALGDDDSFPARVSVPDAGLTARLLARGQALRDHASVLSCLGRDAGAVEVMARAERVFAQVPDPGS